MDTPSTFGAGSPSIISLEADWYPGGGSALDTRNAVLMNRLSRPFHADCRLGTFRPAGEGRS